jgi:chromosome segregation ATPase
MESSPLTFNSAFHQAFHDFPQAIHTRPLHQYIEQCRSNFISYVLSGRVQQNWKTIVLIAGVAMAVTGFFLSFFSGSIFISANFGGLAFISAFGAYFLEQYSHLEALQTTVSDLHTTKDSFETLANNLQKENTQLKAVNQELSQTNERFRVTNQELRATNQELRETRAQLTRTNQELQTTLETTKSTLTTANDLLTKQVAELTLRVTQLTASAERIKDEVEHFKEQNADLCKNAKGFDTALTTLKSEIETSHALCELVSNHLTSQQETFGNQLTELSRLLTDLSAKNKTLEKIREISNLNTQILEATQRLKEVQMQYARERTRLEEIGKSLTQLQNAFSATNSELYENVHDFTKVIEKLKQLVSAAYQSHNLSYPKS